MCHLDLLTKMRLARNKKNDNFIITVSSPCLKQKIRISIYSFDNLKKRKKKFFFAFYNYLTESSLRK